MGAKESLLVRHRQIFRLMPLLVFSISVALFGTALWQIESFLRHQVAHDHLAFSMPERILRLNGELSLTARMAAFTGDVAWVTRYKAATKEFANLLKDADVEGVIGRSKNSQREAIEAVESTRKDLSLIESMALLSINLSDLRRAQQIMLSTGYVEHQAKFKSAVERFSGRMLEDVNGRIESPLSLGRVGWMILALITSVTALLWVLLNHFLRLHESRELAEHAREDLRKTIEATGDVVAIIDAQMQYIELYAGANKWLKIPRDQIVGRSVIEVMGAAIGIKAKKVIEDVLVTGDRRNFSFSYNINGKDLLFEATVDRRDGQSVVAAVTNVTELRAFEAETKML